MMLEDRREITESEILMLIDWYMDMKCSSEKDEELYFASRAREGKVIKMVFIDKTDEFE